MTYDLDALEKEILQFYIAQGLKLAKDRTDKDLSWNFKVLIASRYKQKELTVLCTIDGIPSEPILFDIETTTELMFKKAISHFRELNK